MVRCRRSLTVRREPGQTRALCQWMSLWIVGQAPRLPREDVFPRQAGRLPYKRKRGLPEQATLQDEPILSLAWVVAAPARQPAAEFSQPRAAGVRLPRAGVLPAGVRQRVPLRLAAAPARDGPAPDDHHPGRNVLRAAHGAGGRTRPGRLAALPAAALVRARAGPERERGPCAAGRLGRRPATNPGLVPLPHALARAAGAISARVRGRVLRVPGRGPGDRDAGGQRARRAGHRAVRVPADDHDRRGGRAVVPPARVGAKGGGLPAGTLRRGGARRLHSPGWPGPGRHSFRPSGRWP